MSKLKDKLARLQDAGVSEQELDPDFCPAAPDGNHVADPKTVSICPDGDSFYIDVNCGLCGRSGCAAKFDPDLVDW